MNKNRKSGLVLKESLTQINDACSKGIGNIKGIVKKPDIVVNPGKSVWSEGPVVRGELIEEKLGRNLHQNFPIIDRFENGVATSIKSIDLNAQTYLNPVKLSSKLKSYVNKVGSFAKDSDVRLADDMIEKSRVSIRSLELAIPHAGTPAQRAVIKDLQKYADMNDVTVKIININ